MDAFEIGTISRLQVEVYTSDCVVSGSLATRCTRVADIVNLLGSSHLVIDDATLRELAAPEEARSAGRLHVALDEVLVVVANSVPAPRPEMRIPKRAARADVLLSPYRLRGLAHVGIDSRAVDGVVNGGDRFLTLTAATISSARYPDLSREVTALAFRRDRAQVLAVAEDDATSPFGIRPEEAQPAEVVG